jgi:hypothetical protein
MMLSTLRSSRQHDERTVQVSSMIRALVFAAELALWMAIGLIVAAVLLE